MRIRKRQVLLQSSLSPLPLSDPHLMNRSPVVVQLSQATSTAPKSSPVSLDRRQPSDQPLPSIGKPSNGSDDPSGSGAHGQHNKQLPLEEVVRGEEGEGEKSNHSRKGLIFGSEIQAEVLPPTSPSFTTQDGRWCEGEKAIPLKKRRGSFEENNNNGKKMKARMKTKMNKKCSTPPNDVDNKMEEGEEEKGIIKERKADKKRGIRGSGVMEGSRCSRVNGRGWRCCQPTLVGYSLCEHHLGKGRLRSMTSVRSRSAPKKVAVMQNMTDSLSSSSSSLDQKRINDDSVVEDDEKKPVVITKKRMKLGMVKARSISSLLGQTNSQINMGVARDDDENNK